MGVEVITLGPVAIIELEFDTSVIIQPWWINNVTVKEITELTVISYLSMR